MVFANLIILNGLGLLKKWFYMRLVSERIVKKSKRLQIDFVIQDPIKIFGLNKDFTVMNDSSTAINITLLEKKDKTYADCIWIISKSRYTNFDLSRIWEGVKKKTVMEYKISELGRYLLNPNPIQIKKKLVGCEIRYRTPFHKVKEKIRKILPQKFRGELKDNQIQVEVLKSDWETDNSPSKDDNLESHLNKITELLRPYNPIIKSLNKIDPNQVLDVVGTCEDIGGHPSTLNIPGSITDKLNYIKANISKDVGVIVEKAYIADGLFEMKGFNFKS